MLAAASLIPGIDTFADMVAFGVDALRGDLATAGLDLVGAIPIVGEAADTAKLARLGLDTADAAVDMAKAMDKAGDVAKAADKAEDLYTAAKVDGTIQGFLDAADDPIAEMRRMSKSIAKTSPIQIPEGATVKLQAKKNYYQIKYKWIGSDGYFYEVRWHTRNSTAPLEQRDAWIMKRGIKGVGHGLKNSPGFSEILVAPKMWVDWDIWEDAIKTRKNGNTTREMEKILKNGHWKA